MIANNKNHTRHTGRGAKVTGISDPMNPSGDLAYDSGEMNYQAVKNIADIAEFRLWFFLRANADDYPLWRDSHCSGLVADVPSGPNDEHGCGCGCSRCCGESRSSGKSLLAI